MSNRQFNIVYQNIEVWNINLLTYKFCRTFAAEIQDRSFVILIGGS